MSSAPAPHPDSIGAFLCRLCVLLVAMLGAIIDDLVAEHASLPPRHPMRPVLLAHIASLRVLRAGIQAQADAAPAPSPAPAPPNHRLAPSNPRPQRRANPPQRHPALRPPRNRGRAPPIQREPHPPPALPKVAQAR